MRCCLDPRTWRLAGPFWGVEVFNLTRNAQRALLILLIAFTIIQGVAVIRNTTWPIEHWLGAW